MNHIDRLWFLLQSIGRYDLVNGVFLYSKFAEQKRKVYFDYDYSIRDKLRVGTLSAFGILFQV